MYLWKINRSREFHQGSGGSSGADGKKAKDSRDRVKGFPVDLKVVSGMDGLLEVETDPASVEFMVTG